MCQISLLAHNLGMQYRWSFVQIVGGSTSMILISMLISTGLENWLQACCSLTYPTVH